MIIDFYHFISESKSELPFIDNDTLKDYFLALEEDLSLPTTSQFITIFNEGDKRNKTLDTYLNIEFSIVQSFQPSGLSDPSKVRQQYNVDDFILFTKNISKCLSYMKSLYNGKLNGYGLDISYDLSGDERNDTYEFILRMNMSQPNPNYNPRPYRGKWVDL